MKLLLHICCGPCAVYPVSVLQRENIDFSGFFYNPNIHPVKEYQRRKENVEILSGIKNINVDYMDDIKQSSWERFTGSEEQRCTMCYSLRFDKTASIAKEKGFDAFTTTLLVSPYQKHDLMRELGEKYAEKYEIEFYYRDFRPGFREGQQQARDLGLYRQKFCGCIKSLEQSEYKEKILSQYNSV